MSRPVPSPLPVRPHGVPWASVLALAALAACDVQMGDDGEDATRTGARRTEAPLVIPARVERRPMVRYLETTTKVESEREIAIHPETTGIVLEILAEEGQAVAEGDVLCVLDSRQEELAKRDAEVALQEAEDARDQPELDRAEAEARVTGTRLSWEQAVRDHERDQRLFESSEVASPVSQQTLEASRLAVATALAEHEQAKIARDKVSLADAQARTAVSRAEVALARAEHDLALCRIEAPFAGTIAERAVRLGQSVGPADPIFVLTDTENIRAVFYRAQEELDLFRPRTAPPEERRALTFSATTEALPGAAFPGRVQRISPTIDRDSGQFRVTGVFDPPSDPSRRLLPGMLVRLRIATDEHPDALVVPKRAVRREGELAYVLAIEDDRVRRVAVDEGYSDEDFVEVLPRSGQALTEGSLVIAVGSRDLEDGDRVRIQPPEAGEGASPED